MPLIFGSAGVVYLWRSKELGWPLSKCKKRSMCSLLKFMLVARDAEYGCSFCYGGSFELSSEHNSGAAKQQSSPAAAEESMYIYVHAWYGLGFEFEFVPQ